MACDCEALGEYVSTPVSKRMISSRRGNQEQSAKHSNSHDPRSEGRARYGSAERIWSQIATASKRTLRYRPSVFTEHGALQAANVLRSDRAIAMSVYV